MYREGFAKSSVWNEHLKEDASDKFRPEHCRFERTTKQTKSDNVNSAHQYVS